MASVADLAAALQAAVAQAREADAAIAAARHRYAEATGPLAVALDGTASDELAESLAALADATGRLDEARATIAAATVTWSCTSPRLLARPAAPRLIRS